MNLRILRYFCAACEQGSAVAAARHCHVTQPVISSALAQLEDELDTVLFLRRHRGLEPTPAGKRLYTMARKLLADSRAIVRAFRDDAADPVCSLRVLPSLSIERTQALLSLLRHQLPRHRVYLSNESAAELTLTASNCAPAHTDFLPLWRERYVLVVPEDDPLAVATHPTLADLHGHPFIERDHCENAAAFHALLGDNQVVPDTRARVTSEEWALGLCAAGIGVALCPAHAALPGPGIVIREDLPELSAIERVVGLAYAAPRPLQGPVADVLATCEENAAALAILPGE